MKKSFLIKIISVLLVIATLTVSLPINVFAESVQGAVATEVYMKSVKLAHASTKAEAKKLLEDAGYIFFDCNLNEGTAGDGVWIGYTTTTDPNEAIYDIKLMNTEGGYTLTSMESVLESQKSTFAQMATDLNCLVEEFVEAYNDGSVPAKNAYMALNFFRVVDGESELTEKNGLGYQIVNGGMTFEKLTNMILFCDGTIFDSVVKILTMGVQLRTDNWMEMLADKGEYDSEISYGDDEAELKRRAKQLLVVLQLYAQTYNSMNKMGLVSGSFDEQGNIQNNNTSDDNAEESLSAQEADLVKVDINRVKSYKLVFDELENYKYGKGTLKDFFCSLEKETDEKVLYPLLSVLSDGEFAALSYGCFIEVALGANAKTSDFDDYAELYEELTKDVKSLYLYSGVNPVLIEEDSVIGFTDTASRHMALTGEYQFYEKESSGEDTWENGRYAAIAIGAAGSAIMGASKLMLGFLSMFGMLSSSTASGATGIIAGIAKVCAVSGSGYVTLIALAVAVVIAIVTYVIYVVDEDSRNSVDWEANPIPEYMYDVQEVGFSEVSQNDGVESDYIKRPAFVFYEVVRDTDGRPADLNARSDDSSKWISMYVSYDRPGDESKPIKADSFRVNTGNGETPEGYVPVSRFGGVASYNLNQWDKKDDVNGIYTFYQQDQKISVGSDRTYYVYEVQLQTGESTAHCTSLLEAAGYTPLNVNLSPDYNLMGGKKVFTYLGYKVTNNPSSAITDIRMDYGTPQGTVQLGGITYANCGSSAGVTLYATKYKAAGTPLLASGLKCVNSHDAVPAGYEPVCFLSGGPAVSFNTTRDGIKIATKDYFIYFLPETTFTGGQSYLGGMSYFYCDDLALTSAFSSFAIDGGNANRDNVLAFLKEKVGMDYPTGTTDEIKKAMNDYAYIRSGYHYSSDNILLSGKTIYSDSVLYYITYNPYRAIYSVKGTYMDAKTNHLTIESQGYVTWNTVWLSGTRYSTDLGVAYGFAFSYNGQSKSKPLDMSANLYFAGNPSKNNVYDAQTKTMSVKQPIGIDDLMALDKSSDNSAVTNNSAYLPVPDYFSSTKEAITVQNKTGNNREYVFYAIGAEEERPYVSAITAIDKLTLFRASGGADAGLSRRDITNNMLLAQLAKQGATNFAEIEATMYRQGYSLNAFVKPLDPTYKEMNVTKFGYTRTSEGSAALRDVFIYVSGFSGDEPPKELYRGNTKYTLLCELSGNLTGYEEAPQPGIYLYGTVDKKAGGRIIDVEFSDTPFKEGYETVRTMNGRSMWAEATDYMTEQQKKNFMSGAKTLYEALANFFGFESENVPYDKYRAEKYYYIHIKREGDDIRTQKPYISELYLSSKELVGGEELRIKGILDDLFDRGAEGYLNLDLNYMLYAQNIYLGYSYTADPNDAVTGIRPSHSNFFGDTITVSGGAIKYYLVENIDLNAGAGGDKIYLYYTKSHHEDAGKPITEIRYCMNSAPSYTTTDSAEIMPAMRFDSWKASDLNGGTGKYPIYLTLVRPFETPTGTYKELNYGANKTYTRKNTAGSATGKYLAALYVMDKNTIRQEKLASGVASDQCTCAKISDQEVIDRLKKMGATTVLSTPISIKGGEYGDRNDNKVFIGYSRTDVYSKAIKNIAIKAELLSTGNPESTIDIGKKTYNLVAEAATKVSKLPEAINLIGTEDGQDLLIPRFYLYTSTTGEGDPIYDICIDSEPLKNGWSTVMSENEIEPFTDIYKQAKLQAELGDKDDDDSYDNEIVYTDELYKWMESIEETFDPVEEEISTFFIHCKKAETNVSDVRPYVSEIYIAAGDSRLDALSQLVAYDPDGYIDYDLNEGAGGYYIYLAYKRTADKTEAIKDLVVCYGKAVEKRDVKLTNGKKIKCDLASPVNLNEGSTIMGANLYLYYTTKKEAGEPIRDLYVTNKEVYKKDKGFVTDCTVQFASEMYGLYQVIDTDPDLNDGAGGDYIYLNMRRSAPEASNTAGTLLGKGSIIAISVLAGVGLISALVIVYFKRKKKI